MNSKFHDFIAQLTYVPWTLRLIWSAAKRWTIAWIILLIVQGVLPTISVYLTRPLVNSMVVVIDTNGSWESILTALYYAILMIVVMLLTQVMQSIMEWVRTGQAEHIRDYLSALIHNKSVSLDLAFYEAPEYHDLLERAQRDLSSRPLALLESGGNLVKNSITLVTVAMLLIPYGMWLPFALLLSTLPAFYVVLRFNRRYHRWWEKTTADRRRTQYYDTVLTHSATAAELRLFDFGAYFQPAFQTLRKRLRTERLALSRDQSLARLGAGFLGVAITGVALIVVLWRGIQGTMTLGDFALFYQAFNRGQTVARAVLGDLGQLFNNTLFLGNLFEFLTLEPKVVDPFEPLPIPHKLETGICFQEVSFCYPGSKKNALQEFNFEVPAGQIVAIVGPNGAGKSTLLKLLCRFYDPQVGQIKLDGVDLREFPLKELRRMFTVLFQWPVPYQATAAENISLGDLSISPDLSELENAARMAGAHDMISQLPSGYNTQLGKWFANGVELSGGEWQRLALARAFLRKAPVIILDEPTSALDSWAEADWFDRFRQLANGRTAVIITHRFTIAKDADLIYVMDEGRIVESGKHEELLGQDGLYAQSWTAQTEVNRLEQAQLVSLSQIESPREVVDRETFAEINNL